MLVCNSSRKVCAPDMNDTSNHEAGWECVLFQVISLAIFAWRMKKKIIHLLKRPLGVSIFFTSGIAASWDVSGSNGKERDNRIRECFCGSSEFFAHVISIAQCIRAHYHYATAPTFLLFYFWVCVCTVACENVNNFNKIREIIQNACYCFFI